jgi:hypothetical protein
VTSGELRISHHIMTFNSGMTVSTPTVPAADDNIGGDDRDGYTGSIPNGYGHCKSDGYGGCASPSPSPTTHHGHHPHPSASPSPSQSSASPSASTSAASAPSLPVTGGPAADIGALGFSVVAVGVAAVLWARKRRRTA